MRIGVSIPNRHSDAASVVPYALSVARAAGRGNADLVMVGDKHADALPLAQGPPLLARLLPEILGASVAAALFLAPLWDHLHLLETVGTLTELAAADGLPFLAIIALGRSDHAARALDRERVDRVERVEEAIAGLRRLPIEGVVGLGTAPPVWVAAEREPAIRRAALRGDGWLANAGYAPPQLAEQVALCRDAAPAPGFRMAVRRDVVCCASDSEARDEARQLLAAGYRGFGDGAIIAGDPRRCAASLRELSSVGFDTVVVRPASQNPARGAATVARLLAEARPLVEEP